MSAGGSSSGRVVTSRVMAFVALLVTACGGADDDRAGVLDSPASAAEACTAGDAVVGDPLRVVGTVAPITDIVATIAAGSGTEVAGLVPEGVDSHTFEPSPSVAAAVETADVVFLNGLGLEASIRRLALAGVARDATVCELGTAVLPVSGRLFDATFPESAGTPNPHLWTNPPMVDEYAGLVRDVLVRRDPANEAIYDANRLAFSDRIGALDSAIREASATIADDDRVLVTYHDAYAYFAREYGWTMLAAVQPSSFDEPTPRDVARLIQQIDEAGVTAIFGSEVFPSPILEVISRETGAQYVTDLRDDDLPGDPGDAEHSWFGLMRFNYVTLIEALGGDAGALRALALPSATT